LLARAASALVPVAVIAGVLWYLAHAGGAALQVTAAHVSAAPATPTCGDTIDVVGTITTNGQAGDIAYTWTRNDGQPAGGTLHESVAAGQTAVTVHLAWSVEGRGRYNGVATLDVVSPSALRAVGGFTYACG
jgi:hypothetical protein